VASIAIAGAGPVAQSLGWLLSRSGYPVRAVASRTPERAAEAASFIGGAEPASYEDLGRISLPTIVAVTDTALPDVAARIASATSRASIALHTCGANGPEVLSPLAERGWSVGVMHPLQSVPNREQGCSSLPEATFGVGGGEDAAAVASAMAAAIGGRVLRVRHDAFATYHAAAVVAGNGIFALFEAACAMMAAAGIDAANARGALAPLVRTSLANACEADRDRRLTGPVARGDAATIGRHVAALLAQRRQVGPVGDAPDAALLYGALTSWLLPLAERRGLHPDLARSIRELARRSTHGGAT